MVQTTRETLLSNAEKARQSLNSISALLAETEQLAKTGDASPEALLVAQKQALLDSFAVKKFHRDYKEWENASRAEFVQTEIKPYNQKCAEMARMYTDFESSQAAYEELRKNTQIPPFDFSIQTIRQYENGVLLERVEKNASGEYPSKVPVSKLFSLDENSRLPPPSFPVFNRLVNLEYRLRMLLQIKHDVLMRAKTRLAAKNTQWASRDTKLNQFLTRDFGAIYEEIKKTKASEYEDLKYYEEDLEEDLEADLEADLEDADDVDHGSEGSSDNEDENDEEKDEGMDEDRDEEKNEGVDEEKDDGLDGDAGGEVKRNPEADIEENRAREAEEENNEIDMDDGSPRDEDRIEKDENKAGAEGEKSPGGTEPDTEMAEPIEPEIEDKDDIEMAERAETVETTETAETAETAKTTKTPQEEMEID